MAIWIIIGIDMATRLITSCLIYKSKDIYGSELLIDNKESRRSYEKRISFNGSLELKRIPIYC